MWQPRLDETARMKYLGVVEALEADIRARRIAPGERLPPQRRVAEALGIDLTTVTRAFNEARRRGLIAAQAGRGTFIRDDVLGEPRNQAQPTLDLSMNIPPQPSEPDFRKLLPQTIAAILAGNGGLLSLHYQESNGTPGDRAAAAKWLQGWIAPVADDRILVAGGAQSALFALCRLLLRPGDVIAAGTVTYPGLTAAARQCDLRVAALGMDEQGLIPEDFARLCQENPPKALYVIPTIDNPTTATLPALRRQQIVEIARRHQVTIIEDDPYAPLRERVEPAFVDLAPELCWHLATLSKAVTPALRVAYVVAPTAHLALQLAGVLRATNLMAPPILAAVASRWISDGTIDAVTAAIRAESRARQTIAASVFAGQDVSADPEGHHLWLRLPAHWRADDFAEHADRAGVSIVAGRAFAVSSHPVEAVRISLGVAPDRDVLEEGLSQLAALLGQTAAPARAVV